MLHVINYVYQVCYGGKKAENLVVAQRGRHSLIKCYEEEKK